MSGGPYDYQYYKLDYLAGEIEEDFKDDGKYIGGDYSVDLDSYGMRPTKVYDRFEGATKKQRLMLLREVTSLVSTLRLCAKRAKEVDFFLSGDTSINSWLENLKDIYLETETRKYGGTY